MSGWDINVSGVSSVLKTTGETAGKLKDELDSYQGNMKGAAGHAGTLAPGGEAPKGGGGLVGAALAEFAQHTQNDLKFIAARTSKSLNGAKDATVAYANGDQEMAERLMHEVEKAVTPQEIAAMAGKGGAGSGGTKDA
ncbi:DUF6507 family protein [Streptomyces sp. ET3-23]|uniref:DUF6507 family protein n=1 Tax=Streptomyces sp. ET3-23 TaxID=2885643 RepID=UPI001D0FE7AF|nr:DUF6507 family protein [Streptomyces sp. ET3-23]MCC2278601.1 DUF6507 family protein [Streptomyces sp. ET3-23]